MLKPEERPTRVGADEIDRACSGLKVIGAHLTTGIYGALTPDRDEYSHGFEWPLACAPIGFATLEAKFARTFGAWAAAYHGDDRDD